jgi:hypothetical protein
MLLGFTLPCTPFFSWMNASPRATPRAIRSRASRFRCIGEAPILPAIDQTQEHQQLLYSFTEKPRTAAYFIQVFASFASEQYSN